jgi:hypothetical protein
LNPQILLKLLDDGIASPLPYAALYKELRDGYLEELGDTTKNVAALLSHLDDNLVEDAYRQAGFVMGVDPRRRKSNRGVRRRDEPGLRTLAYS